MTVPRDCCPSSRWPKALACLIAWLAMMCGGLDAPLRAAEEEKASYQDPRVEQQAFQLADGVQVELFASEPMIANPLQMAFDTRGRLWVLCSPTYPHVVPGKRPNDFLAILEDTDRNGKADKQTVFADGLYVPTGFAFGDGGVYVASQPNLWFMKDTDGDDRADDKKVFLSGFGTEDNHHAISVFRWGPDGRLYFRQGVFLHSNIETPHGIVRINETGGVFRLRPREQKLEVHVQYGTNPWGFTFDRWGQNFLAESPQGGIYFVAPNAQKGIPTERAPTMAAAPKSCGIVSVESRHFPADWQGDLILNAFKSQQVLRYAFSEDGSGFAAKELQPPLIASAEPNFRPVDVALGPDGAIYVCDWYNPIIGHMQYNFRDPRRDHTHGRIWRLRMKDRPLLDPPRIHGASVAELVAHLKSPESYTREHARHALYDRDAREVARALKTFVAGLDPNDPEREHHRLEALWTYQTIRSPAPELLRAVLKAPEPRARAAAVRVIPDWQANVPDAANLLAEAAADVHPRVRLEAVVASTFVASPASYEVAMSVLDRPVDRFIEFALKYAVPVVDSYRARGAPAETAPARVLFLVKVVRDKKHIPALVKLLDAGQVPADRQADALSAIGELGEPAHMRLVLDKLLSSSKSGPHEQRASLAALTLAVRDRNVRPEGNLAGVAQLFGDEDEDVATGAVRLAGLWRLESLREDLNRLAQSASARLGVRRAALSALATLGGPESLKVLAQLSSANRSPAVRTAAIADMAALDLKSAADLAADLMAEGDNPNLAALLTAFLNRKEGASALASSLADKKLSADVGRMGLRTMYASGRQDAALMTMLNRAAGVTQQAEPPTAAEVAKIVAEAGAQGDPARGEVIFRRKDLTCQKCHAINGGGGRLGPDLAGLGAGAPPDYIVESILAPNKAIREGYSAVALVTDEGKVLQGIRVRQTDKELVLRDANENEILVPLDSIEEQRDAGSLMPAGMANLLTHRELVDLVRFISLLGKPGPYATPNVPVVRSWQVLAVAPDNWSQVDFRDLMQMFAERRDLPWLSEYSQTSGELPPSSWGKGSLAIVRGQIDVTTPGPVLLRLNSTAGLKLMVDRHEVPLSAATQVELAQGVHTLTFRIERAVRGNVGLRVELDEAPGSPARVQVVSAAR